MLRHLSIRNYLLIDGVDLPLAPGLTAITGETGSGKSIIIGALGLAMGERAEGQLARNAEERCVIELEVDGSPLPFLSEWCQQNGVPDEQPLILRRQIEPGGRSRAFINDTPVRLEQMRDLGARLVHIHSQHQTLLLNSPQFQLGLLDHFAGTAGEVAAYSDVFLEWQRTRSSLAQTQAREHEATNERDYLQFQFDELEAARLVPNESAELETALQRAEHAEELIATMRAVEEGLTADGGVVGIISGLRQLLAKAARMDPALGGLAERLQSVLIETKDIGEEAATMAGNLELDPREAERLRERFDLLARLQHKHRADNSDALIALRDSLGERIATIGSLADEVEALRKKERFLGEKVHSLAGALAKKRQKAATPLGKEVTGLLQELGMPQALFTLQLQPVEPGPRGVDRVQALFTANKERVPMPLDKVASGGELGRVMLALISLAARGKELPTVIFDEIDSGISGETAHKVGALLARMGDQRQVLAITHLPQIAGKAGTHLLVAKDSEGPREHTTITPLGHEQRVQALARMLSGERTTKAALANAKELLGVK